jgi:hypothetical protein
MQQTSILPGWAVLAGSVSVEKSAIRQKIWPNG